MAETQQKILDIKVNYNEAIKAIAEYQTKIDAARDAEKNLKKQLKDVEISRQQYNEEMAASKIAIADYNDAIRIINKTVQNQIKQEKEQEGSLKALRAQLSNLTAEYDALSEAERKGARGEELKKSINEVTDALKGGEEETQRYYRNVGNYEEAIKSAIGLNSSFADSLFKLQESTDGNFFQGLTTNVKAFGKTLLGLLSNPVFLALAGIAGAGMAFKWFYDYNKGLVEATRLTKQFTGLGGDELKAYRNEVQVLADTYGKDFTEVLRSANTLSKQFGIEQQEALGLIKDGFIAGADASGEFMDILREYPAHFNEAGISAEEFVAITANATQQGIFSDKGIDAIKEANIRLREMTTATADALEGIGISSKKVQQDLQSGATTTWEVMQQVSDKLNELPEASAQVGTAIADIFGDQGEDAGLAYLRTLGDIDLSLDNLKSKTGALGEAQEELMDSQLNLQNAISGLVDLTGGGFENMETAAKSFLNNGVASILNGIRDLIQWFRDLYDESVAVRAIFQGLSIQFKLSFDVISTLLKSLLEQFKLVGNTIKAVFTLDWDTAKAGFEKYKKNMLDNTIGLAKDIKNIFQGAYNEVVNPSEGGVTEQDVNTTPVQNNQPTKTGRQVSELEAVIKAKKKELEAIRNAEDAMLVYIKDNREKQRKEIELQYDREIEDLKARLNTEKDLTSKAKEAINQEIKALEQQKAAELQKLSEEELQKEIDNRTKLISLQLEAVKKGSEQEYQLRMQQLASQRDAELADKELTEQMKQAITAKYNKQMDDLAMQHEKDISERQSEAVRVRMENELMQLQQSGASELEVLRMEEQQKLELLESMRQMDGESEQDFLNRKLLARQDYLDKKKELADAEVEIENAKMNAMAAVMGGMAELLEQAGENNRSALVLAKTLAIAEVAISQGVAIANAVKAASKGSVTVWDLVANIATAITTVISTIASATKSIKSAKFANGGLVTGPGTGTSDSIPAQLSNGESVITARATSMFAPILSSFNQMGGGVPINVAQTSNQTLGEDMLARAVAKGVRNIRPVVSVEEITRVDNRVKALENLGSL